MERARALARVCQPHQRRRHQNVDRARARGMGGRQPSRPATHRGRAAERRAQGSTPVGPIGVFIGFFIRRRGAGVGRGDRHGDRYARNLGGRRRRRRARGDDDGEPGRGGRVPSRTARGGRARQGQGVLRGVLLLVVLLRLGDLPAGARKDPIVPEDVPIVRPTGTHPIVPERVSQAPRPVALAQRPTNPGSRRGFVSRRVHPGLSRARRRPNVRARV
mmetsp:Transcript_9393/g.36556  ORF Transcript_9393/g.36556 Transcript_9393/m.36556 type:complete len:218 (+) Transcript_9393:187-840(+)